MLDRFDVFPFNLPAGLDFLIFYAGLSTVVLLAAWVIRAIVGDHLDRNHRMVVMLNPGGSYRSDAGPEVLLIGEIPRPEDALALAYLFGGATRVAELLLSMALAQEWLGADLTVNAAPRDGGPQRAFHARLSTSGGRLTLPEVLTAAKATASTMVPTLRRTLENSGLLHTSKAHRKMRWIILAATAVLVAVACIRLSVRASMLGDAPFPVFLLMAMICVVVIGLQMAAIKRTPRVAREYRGWLKSATYSLRADVASRRRQDVDDIAIAVAVSGAAILIAYPMMAAYAFHMQAQAAAGRSSSGSSCSSSGGGGGCGGGGCGGGGCGGGGGCS